jgi:drug/metabolite transporter (DMT)-like permease
MELTLPAFLLVLAAALLHAGWNFWLKVTGDRLAALAAIGTGWSIVGLFAVALLGVPEPAVWPYLLASTFVHTLYSLMLIRSYRLGSLSVAYPIARGIGPLVVAVVSSVYLGETLGSDGILGIALIAAGTVWLGLPTSMPAWSSLMLSIATGVLIGMYTLLDGLGGRIGASPHVFAAWLFVLTAFPVIAIALAVHRSRLLPLLRPILPKGLIAGVVSAAAYWIVIWAMSGAHMGLVAALRESSVVFAALLGAVFLDEQVRWPGIMLVFAGIVLVKLA